MVKIYVGVGHGGSDPGAVSGKHIEKNYALDIANACTAELRRRGVEVMQSRTSDITESTAAKVAECNKFNPDLAADIHLNAGEGDGFEVYHTLGYGEGEKLAYCIETAVKELGQNSRGLKIKANSSGRDYFGFIRETKCPALLVECAFIDSADVQAVDTLAERQKFGRAIAHGMLDYLDISVKAEKPSGSSAVVVKLPDVAVQLPQLGRGLDNPEYQVKRVQLCLNEMGHTGADGKPLTVDGDFGANTEAAVKKLQKAHNIPTDGRMTAKTWRALLVFKK